MTDVPDDAHLIAGSPQATAQLAGVLYVLNIASGAAAAMLARGPSAQVGDLCNLFATACYVGVTWLFYHLFKPAGRRLSLAAAAFSLIGCTMGALQALHLAKFPINNLGFFGLYCLTIGALIVRSDFVPSLLGVLLGVGGLSWLTFLAPPLSHALFPYNMAPGIIGESVLTLWLLFAGVNEARWRSQALRLAARA